MLRLVQSPKGAHVYTVSGNSVQEAKNVSIYDAFDYVVRFLAKADPHHDFGTVNTNYMLDRDLEAMLKALERLHMKDSALEEQLMCLEDLPPEERFSFLIDTLAAHREAFEYGICAPPPGSI